jgi:hypothetical protein
MQGVLPLAVELQTFGSPGGLQIPNFSKCWASPPHLAKVGVRQYMYVKHSLNYKIEFNKRSTYNLFWIDVKDKHNNFIYQIPL